ncbi:hypothetical protein V2A60_008686 [Cordyceps javanica]
MSYNVHILFTYPEEQVVVNALVRRFNRYHSQKLLIEWLIDANISFHQPEHRRLYGVFEYLKPSVAVMNAHIPHDTVRRRIVELHRRKKSTITICEGFQNPSTYHLMAGAPGIGTPCTEFSAMLMEPKSSRSWRAILDSIGYITFDDAGKMDTATDEMPEVLGFEPLKREVCCFGHVLNVMVKALLFGHEAEIFEAEIDGEPDFFSQSENPKIRHKKPMDVVLDDLNRWLSTLRTICSYFDNTWADKLQLAWLQEAKKLVEDLWESEYKTLSIPDTPEKEPLYKRPKTMRALKNLA